MIVPDDAEQLIASFALTDRLISELRQVLEKYIPENYPTLRRRRVPDNYDEIFVYQRIIAEDNVRHVFTMFVDDARATDLLFLRDIAYSKIEM